MCRECRAGDALPAELQGIPGARQLNLLTAKVKQPRRPRKMTIEDPAKAACRERCADFGDPPCFEIGLLVWKPCDDCLRDIGAEVLEPIDPNAVVAPLL